MTLANLRSSKKAKAITAIVVAIVAIAAIALSAVSCSKESATGEIDAGKAIARAVENTDDNIEARNHREAASEDTETSNEGEKEQHSDADEAPAAEAPQAAKSAEPDNRRSTKPVEDENATSPSSPQPAPEPAKKWVEDTESVWVEDRAAWTEQVPVYGTKEVSICNVCGADITGNASSHGKAHMLAGEGSGHHSEVRQEVIGYDVVNHPAEGHYETKVNGGHWER